MSVAAFMAGMAVGYKLGRAGGEYDLKVKVGKFQVIHITIGDKSYTVENSEDLTDKIIQPENTWDHEPYYAGWRDEIDEYILMKELPDFDGTK